MSYIANDNYYQNPRPRFYADEKQAPVPGWGVTPNMAGPRRIGVGGYGDGFGYDLTISTPIGKQKFSIPIEKTIDDTSAMAVKAAWPPLQKKLEAEFPKLLSMASGEVVNNLWPQMQPKLRKEVNYAIGQARQTGYIIGGAVVASVWLAAWWSSKRRGA